MCPFQLFTSESWHNTVSFWDGKACAEMEGSESGPYYKVNNVDCDQSRAFVCQFSCERAGEFLSNSFV